MAVELFEEHSAMLEAAEDFLAAVKHTPRIPPDQLSRKRMRLSSLIRQHRTTEEELIFAPLARNGGFANMPHLETILEEMMREKVKYSEHIRTWTLQAIERDWDGYVAACEERILAFKRVIFEEEARVYQTVLGLNTSQMPLRERNF